jgi:uncharacterized protein
MSIEPITSRPYPVGSLRERLRHALPAAMKARDRVAVAALRTTLAAIDNAEAVDGAAAIHKRLAIEQTRVGVGAAEVERRSLSEAQVEDIMRTEIAEREAAARDYERAGQPQRAVMLQDEVSVLSAHLVANAGPQ